MKLSPTEDAELSARAEAAGVTVARYLVEAALSYGPEEQGRVEAVKRLFRFENSINSIGTNINQLAKVANSYSRVPPEAGPALLAIADVLRRLDDAARWVWGIEALDSTTAGEGTATSSADEWADLVDGPDDDTAAP